MKGTEFYAGVRRLEINYGRDLTKEQKELWFEKIRHWDTSRFLKTVEKVIEEQERFPVLAAFLKRGELVGDEKSEFSGMSKQEAERFFEPHTHQAALAKDCIEFIDTLFKKFPKPSLGKYQFEAGWCRAMARKYPEQAKNFMDQEKEANEKLAQLQRNEMKAA